MDATRGLRAAVAACAPRRVAPRRIAGASGRRHLAAEAGGKHVPWGVAGEGTYTASTKGCFDVIARSGPLVREATERALAARKTRGAAGEPFHIADFGTADGGTSLPLMRNVVAARLDHPRTGVAARAEPDTAIIVGYEDQAQNDWQSLFKLVQGHIEGGPETYYEPDGNVYAVAVGTSFYESCFAPESIDLSFSATAFHWLTSCPADIPDALHSACTADPATKKAFGERARKDWTRILSKRAAELKPGGQLVVANFATDEAGSFLGRTPGKQCMHSNFSDLWLKVAGAEVHALTNFPNEYRALDACRAAFENPFVGLALRSIETDVVPCPYHEEWVSGPQTDARAAAESFAVWISNFRRPTPSSRCRLRSCVCSTWSTPSTRRCQPSARWRGESRRRGRACLISTQVLCEDPDLAMAAGRRARPRRWPTPSTSTSSRRTRPSTRWTTSGSYAHAERRAPRFSRPQVRLN